MNILVVDDDLGVRAYMNVLLDAMNTTMVCAPTVQEAMDILGSKMQIDGALIDLVLSDGNGTEVARAAASRGVPFVFTSAVTDEHNINQMLELGWVIQKPVRIPGLKRALAYFKDGK